MGHVAQQISGLIEPAVRALGYELVGVEYLAQGRNSLLRVYIDSEQGIGLDDCERVSHQVSGILDVEDPLRGHYSLEVSSPGLERPLFTPEHYRRVLGSRVRLRLGHAIEGRRKVSGVLEAVSDTGIRVRDSAQDVEIELGFADIDKANLVPDEP